MLFIMFKISRADVHWNDTVHIYVGAARNAADTTTHRKASQYVFALNEL